MEINKVYVGRMEDVLRDCADCFFDSCVTDPPYGLNFMGKKWDYEVPKVEQFREIFRVLKHGAHILVACGTRTQHRMACAIEDAGFEIRDVITWHYGSGFPKSLDISKQIDKQSGAEREIVGDGKWNARKVNGSLSENSVGLTTQNDFKETKPATPEAKQWNGWGTALKPATEFWTLARKPLSENTVAENVLKHGTGGINIDGSRIETDDKITEVVDYTNKGIPHAQNDGGRDWIEERIKNGEPVKHYIPNTQGRFPANVIFDEFTGQLLDQQTGELTSGHMDTISQGKNYGIYGKYNGKEVYAEGDSGGASRFFYCAKADNYERNKGLKGFDGKYMDESREVGSAGGTNPRNRGAETQRKNHHPTVKPIDLMRYLVKLITPKNGIVLDPFCGSGTTCIGAKLELMKWVGIEMDEEYAKISEARIAAWNPPKYKEQTLF
jgi:DNA modification methylase